MIPRAHVTAWREHAPWPTDAQVEQDLVLSRALVELFSNAVIVETVAFRGGTALHKLFFPDSGRYSEDIDLVQTTAGPIGSITKSIRTALDGWLGKPDGRFAANTVTLTYRFDTTSLPVERMRLKVEINTREHLAMFDHHMVPFSVDNPWFSGRTDVRTFVVEELLATKLRALYQRSKGRDLYDLWHALEKGDIADGRVVTCFDSYMKHTGRHVTRALFEKNLAGKVASRSFREDLRPLLREGIVFDVDEAARVVQTRLVARLPGTPWKGHGNVAANAY